MYSFYSTHNGCFWGFLAQILLLIVFILRFSSHSIFTGRTKWTRRFPSQDTQWASRVYSKTWIRQNKRCNPFKSTLLHHGKACGLQVIYFQIIYFSLNLSNWQQSQINSKSKVLQQPSSVFSSGHYIGRTKTCRWLSMNSRSVYMIFHHYLWPHVPQRTCRN